MQRIGVDAVSVDRIALAVKRSGLGFLHKVYTPAELAYCAGNDERLAGRWAAKEAVIKCFDGTGICFPRRRIEVLPGPRGAPRARLLGDRGPDTRARRRGAGRLPDRGALFAAGVRVAVEESAAIVGEEAGDSGKSESPAKQLVANAARSQRERNVNG